MGAVFSRSLAALPDTCFHTLLHLLCGQRRLVFHQLVKVGCAVCRFQPHAPQDHVLHRRVVHHLIQLKGRVFLLQLLRFRLPLGAHRSGALLVLCRLPQLFGALFLGCRTLQLAFHPVHFPGSFHADTFFLRQRLVVFVVLHSAVLHRFGQCGKTVRAGSVHTVGFAQRIHQRLHLRRVLDALHRRLRRPLQSLLKLGCIFALHQLAKRPALFRRRQLFLFLALVLLFPFALSFVCASLIPGFLFGGAPRRVAVGGRKR